MKPTVFICGDLSGEQIDLGLVQRHRILARRQVPALPEKGIAAALGRIAEQLDSICDEAKLSASTLAGFGLAFPGIIDAAGRILSTPTGRFSDACALDIHDVVRQLFGIPLTICNNSNASLAGEWGSGAACGLRSVVMLTVADTIQTSALINGWPLRGQHGQAGCLGGHMLVNVDGFECNCGNVGCFETEGAGWSLLRRAQQLPGFDHSAMAGVTQLDWATVFRFAMNGDHLAMYLRERSIQVWSAAAVSLVHAYDPEQLILGGEIAQRYDFIVPRVAEYVARHAITPWGRVEVRLSKLGSDATLIGLGWLLLKRVGGDAEAASCVS